MLLESLPADVWAVVLGSAGSECVGPVSQVSAGVARSLRAATPERPRLSAQAILNARSTPLLQWAREAGMPWGGGAFAAAAAACGGEWAVEALSWARALAPPCPWDARVCANAAEVRPTPRHSDLSRISPS